jgi:type VI secretion system protein ImpC
VARQDPRAPELIRQVDEAAARVMRGILHDPSFQSVESAWRTVHELVRRLETGPELKLCLIDMTKEELADDPDGTFDLLVNRTGGWSVLASCFAFGAEDLSVLRQMGAIARRLRAPLLGESDLSLLDESPQWNDFRRTPEAAFVGLALPRVLLRLPYGKGSAPCDTFGFEELAPGMPDSKQMLWANPAPFCAMLIAEAGRPGPMRTIDHLPIYVFREDGESAAMPCAEIQLSEDAAEALLDNGIMPVVSVRGTDEVRILRFQSVADPLCALAGRWES